MLGRRHPLLGKTVQGAAVDLVGRSERQFLDEPDKARVRVGGRIGEREALDLVFARAAPRFRHHECDRLLPLDLVVDRDDGGLGDIGKAMLVASADLPMPGRPAMMMRSEGCRPPILASRSLSPVAMPERPPSRW